LYVTQRTFAGGHALGLGSFRTSVLLRQFSEAGPLLVLVDWRDAIGGQWGADVQSVLEAETGSPDRPELGPVPGS
jgi:hypothetical protein